ncbi:hypothetical protein L218DRAFT_134387 [Marasmius fiardii PR-910]|nr:hypothetical protein L218DRAFT_134387 [Marasmius fiardii PR-910]
MAVTTMQEWCQAELDSYLCNNVWIQPKSGRISLGLDGPWPEISFPVMFDHSHQLQSCSSDMPVLSTGMYNAGDVLNYLLLFSPDEFFLQRLTYLRPSHIFRCEEGCSLPTSQVWARSSGQPIAKFESRWTYYACNFWNQDNLQPTVMADGRTRLSVSSVPHPKDWQRDLPGYRYYRDPMSPDRYLSWLTQAFSFFNALNIRRSKWPDCAMIHSINLDLIPTTFDFSVPAGSSIKFEPPCYLFLTAPPQFPDSTPDLYTWMLGKDLYYWSSDPEGHSIMPESQRESLGLPSFIPDAWAEYYTWDSDMYDVICAWQEKKNFDPTTTDFTASLGYPIFQHISSDMDADKGRFKVLPDDAGMCLFNIRACGRKQRDFHTSDSSYSAREVTMDVDLPSQPQMEIDMGTNMVVD